MKRIIAAAIIAGIGAPAFAQVVSFESQNAAPKQVTGPDDKIICEKVTRTGSRLDTEKVCLTALQWREQKAGQRVDFEKWQGIKNVEPADPQGMASPR